MSLFFDLIPDPGEAAAVLDAGLLVILLAPCLYFFVLRPVRSNIAELVQAEVGLAERNRELGTLNAISSATSSLLETPQILTTVKDLLAQRAGFAAGTISTFDEASQTLRLELTWGVESLALPLGTLVPAQCDPFQEVMREKQVRFLTRAQVTDGYEQKPCLTPLLPGMDTYIGIPLLAQGEIQGLMVLADRSGAREPDAERFRYFQAIGQITGIALHNTRLFAQEHRAHETAEVLRQAGMALTQSLDMATVMDTLLEFTERLVHYDSASVILVEDQDRVAIHAARGCDCAEELKAGGRISLSREKYGRIEEILAGRQGKVLNDLSPDTALSLSPCNASMRSWLGVPFVAGDHVIGLLGLGKHQAGYYCSEQLQMAEALASQAAVAVQNAWLFAQLRASREHLQTLSRQLVEVQENERGYIARELHDEAGQVLTSLMVGLRLLERDAQKPEAVTAGIAKLKTMVDNVLDELHRLAMDLRPASLDYLGLEAALRQHLETVAEQNQITVQIETVGMDLRLPKDIEVALYRIVQEAMANVVRHARATRVDVWLEKRADKLVMIVEDNGIGFNEEVALNSGRLGLFGMRERAEMLGGKLTIESGESGGTTLLVEVPYGNPSPDRR